MTLTDEPAERAKKVTAEDVRRIGGRGVFEKSGGIFE